MFLAIFAARVGGQATYGALPLTAPDPADNPSAPEKVALGRLLFWDPILSGERDVACATCHHPAFAYAEPLDLSIGVTGIGLGANRRFSGARRVPFVQRNTQTVLNAAFNGMNDDGRIEAETAIMFWDGRARRLEGQAIFPIRAVEEMRGDAYAEADALDEVAARLRAIPEYVERFSAAFGGPAPVTPSNMAKAIAAFQRTLITPMSSFDRYMRGDRSAMTARQIRGMQQFADAGCVNCHRGPMFSDFKFHTLGLPDNAKLPASDTGLNGTHGFRTPSLRNVSRTAPYMHNGIFVTIQQVLGFYERVQQSHGTRSQNAAIPDRNMAPLLGELDFSSGVEDIEAFLDAISDGPFDASEPDRVPSGLAVGGRLR